MSGLGSKDNAISTLDAIKVSRYSIVEIARNAFSDHLRWDRVWRNPEPKSSYAVVIIGGGGHGLATAYYLAKEHGIQDIAVLERGWLGGGNTGRNTAIVRSNYLWDESADLYEYSLKLWEKLSQELNFNLMLSQRGLLNLCHSSHEMHAMQRRTCALNLNAIDSKVLSLSETKNLCPIANYSPRSRYPILGSSLQPRAGIARHDAMAWGYARAADDRGVDILQKCEVIGFDIKNNRISGVETSRGFIQAEKIGIAVAGHSSTLATLAGFRLPIGSRPLQAFVSEPLKPVLNTVVGSTAVHMYISQSDKGELVIGGGADQYQSYSQHGSPIVIEDIVAAINEIFPIFRRLRLMRHWGGIVDITPDTSPIIDKTPIHNLYINCGWGTGGFKATPGSGWCFAHTIARDEPHHLNAPFNLARFQSGRLIDEHGATGVTH